MKLFIIILALTALSVSAKPQYGVLTISKVISVYDGDTFRVDINSLPPILGQNIAIRVNGVDTPEIRGKCQQEKDLAIKARDFVSNKLLTAKTITLTNIQRGKYFRIVASVLVDGVSLELALLKQGLAYKYNGGKKVSWCDFNTDDINKLGIYYYQNACDSGNSIACNNLGFALIGSHSKDIVKILLLFKQSCLLNDGKGCSNLGSLYYQGKGVEQSNTKALAYFDKACKLGEMTSCDYYQNLNGRQ